MRNGDLERCPLLWVMLPERKKGVGDIVAGDEPDGLARNANIIGK